MGKSGRTGMTPKQLNDSRARLSGIVRDRRQQLQMTQERLAELTGMGIATIKRFESGRFWLNLKQYVLLCEVLQLELH